MGFETGVQIAIATAIFVWFKSNLGVLLRFYSKKKMMMNMMMLYRIFSNFSLH